MNIDDFRAFVAEQGHDGIAKHVRAFPWRSAQPTDEQQAELDVLADDVNALASKLGAPPVVMKNLEVPTTMRSIDAGLAEVAATIEKKESDLFESNIAENAAAGHSRTESMTKARLDNPTAWASYQQQADALVKAKASDQEDDDEDEEPDDDADDDDAAKAAAPRDPSESPTNPPPDDFENLVDQIKVARGLTRVAALQAARKENPTAFSRYQNGRGSTDRPQGTRGPTWKAAPTDSQLGRAFMEHVANYRRANPKVKADQAMSEMRRRHPKAFLDFQQQDYATAQAGTR
jgi:hypothetical protein